jgi:hypothetical protein
VAQSIESRLRASPTGVAVARSSTGAPYAPGFYAWWLTEGRALPMVPAEPHPTIGGLGLIYVGIAPRDANSAATIGSRIRGNHLGTGIGGSTLRYTLASFLWEVEGWMPFWRPPKPAITRQDSKTLTRWMGDHLAVSWCPTERPWRDSAEAVVIHSMRPPLNRTHNEDHPFYPCCGRARDRLRTAARLAHT